MKILGKLTLLAGLLWSGSAAATTWQPYNTCWQDFDVGGGWFCGLRTAQCASPGLYCTQSVTSEVPPPYGSGVPASKAIALDDAGYVWLIGNDNKIYNEALGWGQFSPAIPLACVKKLAVTGRANENPRIMALGCSGQAYRYLDGAWYSYRSSGTLDVSVSTTTLTYLHNSGGIGMTGPNGGGLLVVIGGGPVVETFPGGSVTHRPSLLAGLTGYLPEYATCTGPINRSVGQANFYSYASYRFLIGDPDSRCRYLRTVQQGGVIKIVSGNRGPGSDHLWYLTDFGRVYSLND
jgi:hypothetical protein